MAIARYSPARIVAVTFGLAVAGAVFGGVAGAVALAVALVLSQDFGHLNDFPLYGVAATVGAILGAGCAPLAGWLLLRHVPLGRAFGWLTIGAIVGGVVGWFLPRASSGRAILIAAALGFLCAALVLRIWHARHSIHHAGSSDDGVA